jgi:hypothetical protein
VNRGNTATKLSQLTKSGHGYLNVVVPANNPFPASLDPNQSWTSTVEFAARVQGTYNATFSVTGLNQPICGANPAMLTTSGTFN